MWGKCKSNPESDNFQPVLRRATTPVRMMVENVAAMIAKEMAMHIAMAIGTRTNSQVIIAS
jgi:hypothetical protein